MFKEKRSYYILITSIILAVTIGFSFIKSPTNYNLLICYIVAKSIFGVNLIATTIGLYFYKFEKNMDDILYSVAGFLMLIPFYINLFDPTKTFSLILAIAFIVVGVSSIAIAVPFCLTTTWKVREKQLMNTYKQAKPQDAESDLIEPEVIETTNIDLNVVEGQSNESEVIEVETQELETNDTEAALKEPENSKLRSANNGNHWKETRWT